jgi:hypothetical protein
VSQYEREHHQLNVRHFWKIRYAFFYISTVKVVLRDDAVNVVNGSLLLCSFLTFIESWFHIV